MKVLIAEDEPREAKALQLLLGKYYPGVTEVTVVGNGREAVAAALRVRPDIIFLDIEMPGMDGLAAGREIRAGDDDVVIIMLTAYSEFEYARQAIDNRVLNYIIKPYSVKTLREAVDKAIEQVENAGRQRRGREVSQRLTGMLQREFLHKIIVNPRLRRDIIAHYASMLGIDIHAYRVLFFEAAGNAHPDQDTCEKLFSRLRAARAKFMHTTFENATCVIVHAADEELLGAELDRIIHAFADDCPDVSYHSSQIQNRWENLAVIYHRTFNRFMAPARQDASPTTVEMEKQLADAVIANQHEKADAICRALVEKAYNKYGTSHDFGFNLMASFRNLLRLIHDQSDETEDELQDWIDGNFHIPYRGDRESAYRDLVAGIDMAMRRLADRGQGRGPQMVMLIKRHLAEHFSGPVSLDSLAELTGMSKFHLCRVFKNTENETITGYLQKLRMEKAKVLLARGAAIADVCADCGFRDPAYFGRIFKKMNGITPAAFSRASRI